MRDNENIKRTALITGASAGIGEAFAHVFAEKGFDVILTARRHDRLQALARELEKKYGISAHIFPGDLADPQTPQRLHDEITGAGLQVDALINNAGYGVPGYYRQTSWEEQRDFIQVLVSAPASLAHLFEPGMVGRGYGRIINVASLAGLIPPSGGHSLYGAAKAFMIRFSGSHALEHANTGINVTALCPGFTYSEFHDVMGNREKIKQLPGFMWMDAETVARQGYDAVMEGKTVYINGKVNRFIAFLAKYLPNWLAALITNSQAKKYRVTDL